MSHLELILLATTSYLFSLWLIERWRRWGRKPSQTSLDELRRPHLGRVLEPVVKALDASGVDPQRGSMLLAALESENLGPTDALRRELAGFLNPPQTALLEATVELVAAGAQRSSFARHRLAVRALRAARRARSVGVEAVYLEVLTLLGFLSDGLTEDVRLWQTRRLLRTAERASDDPLLQLASALRSAVAGQQAEVVAALTRAFYHAREDRFLAGRILATPLVEELSPSLIEEARRALDEEGSTSAAR